MVVVEVETFVTRTRPVASDVTRTGWVLTGAMRAVAVAVPVLAGAVAPCVFVVVVAAVVVPVVFVAVNVLVPVVVVVLQARDRYSGELMIRAEIASLDSPASIGFLKS